MSTDAAASSSTGSPLVGAAELADLLRGPQPPVLLDVRWSLAGPPGREAYAAGHLPSAVFCDLDTVLADPPGSGGRHPLPDPARVEAFLRAAGVSQHSAVVVYDARDSTAAARGWWVLRWAGLRSVRVLDGGYDGWVAAGLPVTREVPVPPSGDVVVRPGAMPVVDADGAVGIARDGVLLDARAAERYRGEVEPVDPVAGHVPGAVSAPTGANVDDRGRFLDPRALRERFTALGIDGARRVAAYCGSGVTAAHQVLALELAGVPAALYAGSWSEWVTDPSRPVATGASPG